MNHSEKALRIFKLNTISCSSRYPPQQYVPIDDKDKISETITPTTTTNHNNRK